MGPKFLIIPPRYAFLGVIDDLSSIGHEVIDDTAVNFSNFNDGSLPWSQLPKALLVASLSSSLAPDGYSMQSLWRVGCIERNSSSPNGVVGDV